MSPSRPAFPARTFLRQLLPLLGLALAGAALVWLAPAGRAQSATSTDPPCVSGCADSDGDALCDSWEMAGGIDLNADGRIDARNDLLLPGADPNRPDIYLEYDYMVLPDQGTACTTTSDCALSQNCVSGVCRGHSHAPGQQALKAVIRSFAAQGIALHIAKPNAIPESRVLTFEPVVLTCAGSDAANFYDLKAVNFDPRRKLAYHYAIFGHYNTCDPFPDAVNCPGQANCCANCGAGVNVGGGGFAEKPGNDLIVSLGSIHDFGFTPGVEQIAGVFEHEVGHNFGLDHAGPGFDTPEFKPNFLSVMNPNFTFPGIPVAAAPGSTVAQPCATNSDCTALGGICSSAGTCTRIDYSGAALATLDENHLNENVGINAGSNDITTYNCPDFTPVPGAATGPIDWNCNGDSTESDIAADITIDGNLVPLTGAADWPNLNYNFQCTFGFADAPPPPIQLAQEMDFKTVLKKHLLFPHRSVEIEVRPGCASKALAPGWLREFSVALLGAEDFDVAAVEPSSLRFQGVAPLRLESRDVNRDGRPDLLLTFNMVGLRLAPGRGPRSARLTGWLRNSQAFTGLAEVTVVPSLASDPCR